MKLGSAIGLNEGRSSVSDTMEGGQELETAWELLPLMVELVESPLVSLTPSVGGGNGIQ